MITPTVLVIDDDTRLRRLLKKYLSENNFSVIEAPSADDAYPLLDILRPDIVIMDMMMPGTDGCEMTRRLRDQGNTIPILMLTAMNDTDNRIGGLESGVDDYLCKPFEPRELLLRLHNILRRSTPLSKDIPIRFGSCQFDLKTGVLTKEDTLVPLTGVEINLLRLLIEQANAPISRDFLMQQMQIDNERTIDVQMTRLRKKVEMDAAYPTCIQTIRGQGYMLVTK
jgi:two-component system phosphate regulon response regulator OmpR